MIVPKKELDVIKQDAGKSEKLAKQIFRHYRKHGFPHFNLTPDNVQKEFYQR